MLKSLIVLMVIIYAMSTAPLAPGRNDAAPETTAPETGVWDTLLPAGQEDVPAESGPYEDAPAPEEEIVAAPSEPDPAPPAPAIPAEPALTDEEAVAGLWCWELEMAVPITALMEQSMPEMAGKFEFTDLVMPVYIKLAEDGSFTAAIDAEAAAVWPSKFLPQAEEFLMCYFEAMIAASGLDMSVEEFMEMSGFSMEDMLQSLVDGVLSEEMMETIVAEGRGYYKLQDGKVYLYNGACNENVYDLYTLDGDTMVIEKSSGVIAGLVGLDEYDDIVSLVYPVVLTRVE